MTNSVTCRRPLRQRPTTEVIPRFRPQTTLEPCYPGHGTRLRENVPPPAALPEVAIRRIEAQLQVDSRKQTTENRVAGLGLKVIMGLESRVCDLCFAILATAEAREAHLKVAHAFRVVPTSLRFGCGCGSRFNLLGQLLRHIEEVHSDLRERICLLQRVGREGCEVGLKSPFVSKIEEASRIFAASRRNFYVGQEKRMISRVPSRALPAKLPATRGDARRNICKRMTAQGTARSDDGSPVRKAARPDGPEKIPAGPPISPRSPKEPLSFPSPEVSKGDEIMTEPERAGEDRSERTVELSGEITIFESDNVPEELPLPTSKDSDKGGEDKDEEDEVGKEPEIAAPFQEEPVGNPDCNGTDGGTAEKISNKSPDGVVRINADWILVPKTVDDLAANEEVEGKDEVTGSDPWRAVEEKYVVKKHTCKVCGFCSLTLADVEEHVGETHLV